MNRYFILIMIAALCCVNSLAQTGGRYDKQIKAQAEKMCAAMVAKDYAVFVKYVHPDLLRASGGKGAMIKTMKDGDQKMVKGGFRFTKVTVGKPGALIDTANTLQCLVPQTVEISSPKGRMLNHSSVLAISSDNGVTWSFVGINPDNRKQLEALLPLSSKIKAPADHTEQVK